MPISLSVSMGSYFILALLSFKDVAKELAIPTSDDGDCQYTRKKLVEHEFHRLSSDLESPYEGDWACVKLKQHLKADYDFEFQKVSCLPSVKETAEWPAKNPGLSVTIQGRIHYFPLVFLPYRYEIVSVESSDNEGFKFKISVRIHFKGPLGNSPSDLVIMDEKLKSVAQHWTDHSPAELRTRFQFKRVEDEEGSDFSIHLYPGDYRPKKRLTYLNGFRVTSSTAVIAHEMGHMMGLDDEYSQIHAILKMGETPMDMNRCNFKSLMCRHSSFRNTPLSYHYYTFLRRALCPEIH